jgi:hypothetical protein
VTGILVFCGLLALFLAFAAFVGEILRRFL